MKFKCFVSPTMEGIEILVNAWLLTGIYYTYSNSFNMIPDGSGGEDVSLMVFYMEK